jgi:hypothetical protein
MAKKKLTVPQQVEGALDGRTQRWLAREIGMADDELSKRMNNHKEFSDEEIAKINKRLSSNITK